MSLAVLVLAAGKGTRMISEVPKVLHKILDKPLINYVLDISSILDAEKIVTVLGYKSEKVSDEISNYATDIVIQDEQRGTGHAVLCAKESLKDFKGLILILSGDVPAITEATLTQLIQYHTNNGYKVSFISTIVEDPKGYGRVIKDRYNKVQKIVEDKDADDEQRKVNEINSGIYCFDSNFLWGNINKIDTNNSQREYYLPTLIEHCVSYGFEVGVFKILNPDEVLGVNSKNELVTLERRMKTKINEQLISRGVTIIDPSSTFISPDVKVGKDTTIYPNTYLYGSVVIGENCTIGPSVYIKDCKLGNNVTVKFSSYLNECVIDDDVIMGPFCHIRPETYVKEKAKIGNFVEIKKSEIGVGSKVPHLSYVGDATVGNNVNIGAGTITCNYDGVNKNRTVIEDNVFIGSDTMLIAPVKIGKEATTAAGSTITKDVASGSLAIERSTQKEVKGWHQRKKGKK